ncbi:hypothetical protein QF035_002368 [Streptomyces umbrinus]|uniref:Secreted protein/lipoprotein n=1 Tax=Streptomyces umbrinus TaxID=67370 RepID=A0ABU0SMJ9_9ACTN|nr:hypothetical protein [Streptomyces umbrinus]MDQ1024786.1 hypothetical protein [Streptomyces umbrinus]
MAMMGLLLAGCTTGSSDAKPLPEGTLETRVSRTPPGPPPPPDADHAEALAAYRAMWDDLAAAAATSDPKHPRLRAHASEGALELLRYMMREDRKKDVVTNGQLRLDPSAENSEVTRAVIRDCADATDWLHYTKDGKLENDVPGGHHRVDATVRQRGGVWRVERLHIDQVGTC